MTDPTPPVQPSAPPGSKTLIYTPQIRIVIASGGQEIDVSKDVIRGRVVRMVDALSAAEFYLNNKNGKYTGRIRRMDKVVIWMKRVKWVQVFTGYLDLVPAYDLFPTEAYFKASCTLKRIKYTYWDKGLPESIVLLNPNLNVNGNTINVGNQAPDGATGLIVHDLLTKVGSWPANQVLIQKIPPKFMDWAQSNIRLVDQQEVFNRILLYIQGGAVANGIIYPWTSNSGDIPVPNGEGGRYTQTQVISLVKGVLQETVSGVSEDKIELAAAYALAVSGGLAQYHNDDTQPGGSGRDMWGFFGLDHLGPSGKTQTLDQLKDPIANIKQAWVYSNQGTNWSYWSNTLGLGTNPSTLASVKQEAPGVAAWSRSPNDLTPSGTALVGNPMQALFEKFYGQSNNEAVNIAIQFAERQIGIPYGSPNPRDDGVPGHAGDGTDHPPTFDCSGLTMMAYKAAGIDLPHSAIEQARKTYNLAVPKANGVSWQVSDLQPGDLLFFPGSAPDAGGDGLPEIGHVAMYVGGDSVIEAAGPPVGYNRVAPKLDGSLGYRGTANFITRPIGLAYSLNDNTGTWTSSNENGGVNPAYRMFNFLFNPDSFDTILSNELFDDFAPANDESLLTTISQLCAASMRSFMSGPNGDFVAFFPDYFGINGTKAVMDIEDVEIVDLKVEINDDALVTHVYAIGDQYGDGIDPSDWLASSGEVSIKMKSIMDQVLAMQSNTGFLSDPDQFIKRFGLRPMANLLSYVRSHYYEFFAALYIFLQQWSKQFSTQVQICFMPELQPGMRMNLVNHNVCVYVESLVHTFDFQEGFQTYPTISCPSTPAGGDNGLPIALGL